MTSKQTSKGKQKPRDCYLCVPYPKILPESQSVCNVFNFNFLTSFIYSFPLTFDTKAWKVTRSVKTAIIYNNNNNQRLYSQQSALQKLEIQVWDRLRSLITSCTPALMCNRHWQMVKVLVSLLLTFDPNVLSKELIFFPRGDWKSLKIFRSIPCESYEGVENTRELLTTLFLAYFVTVLQNLTIIYLFIYFLPESESADKSSGTTGHLLTYINILKKLRERQKGHQEFTINDLTTVWSAWPSYLHSPAPCPPPPPHTHL